jgi:uncharacterized protein
MPHLTALQWALAAAAALMIGFSKTGVPGFGMLSVPVLAVAFGGRASLGTMLPMLIVADLFAIGWYRRHARWDILFGLARWVFVGVAAGAATLWFVQQHPKGPDWPGLLIGVLVLAMLALHIYRRRTDNGQSALKKMGNPAAGMAAGFATTASNAAGPITSLYLSSAGLGKDEFMGTSAWFYFFFNLLKVPIYYLIGLVSVAPPLINTGTLWTNLVVAPGIIVGAIVGRLFLPVISQRAFEDAVVGLAGLASLKLLFDFAMWFV